MHPREQTITWVQAWRACCTQIACMCRRVAWVVLYCFVWYNPGFALDQEDEGQSMQNRQNLSVRRSLSLSQEGEVGEEEQDEETEEEEEEQPDLPFAVPCTVSDACSAT